MNRAGFKFAEANSDTLQFPFACVVAASLPGLLAGCLLLLVRLPPVRPTPRTLPVPEDLLLLLLLPLDPTRSFGPLGALGRRPGPETALAVPPCARPAPPCDAPSYPILALMAA